MADEHTYIPRCVYCGSHNVEIKLNTKTDTYKQFCRNCGYKEEPLDDDTLERLRAANPGAFPDP